MMMMMMMSKQRYGGGDRIQTDLAILALMVYYGALLCACYIVGSITHYIDNYYVNEMPIVSNERSLLAIWWHRRHNWRANGQHLIVLLVYET